MKEDKETRTVTFALWAKRDDGCPKGCKCDKCLQARKELAEVKGFIKRYRHGCRKTAAVLYLAESASAKIDPQEDGDIRITPVVKDHPTKRNKKGEPIKVPGSKELLEACFGTQEASTRTYSMREWLKGEVFNGMYTDFADFAMADVETAWKAKDSRFNATRGWLCLQTSGRVARFQNVGLPLKRRMIQVDKHYFTFSVCPHSKKYEMRFERNLDKSRWITLKNIADGTWEMCGILTIRITRKGKLVVDIPFRRPAKRVPTLKPNRVMEASFVEDREAFIQFKVRSGHEGNVDEMRNYSLSALGALDVLNRNSKLSDKYLERQKSCGSYTERKRGTGVRKAYRSIADRRNGITIKRNREVLKWNHHFTSAIVNHAVQWDCGQIEVFDFSKSKKVVDEEGNEQTVSQLFGRPWRWDEFKRQLEYKCRDHGIKVDFLDPVAAAVV